MVYRTAEGFSDRDNGDYRELLEINELKRLQENICAVGNVFCFCTDAEGNQLTEMSGTQHEIETVRRSADRHFIDAACRRVEAGSLEDQAVEATRYDNVKVAAVSVRINRKPVLNWIVCAVLEIENKEEFGGGVILEGISTVTTAGHFYKTLDFLREVTAGMMRGHMEQESAREESRSSRTSWQQMEESLKRIETFAGIVQLLESDDSIEQIMGEILQHVGEYFELSSCQIFRQQKNGDRLDLLVEWCKEDIRSMFGKSQNIEKFCMMAEDKTRVISADSILAPDEMKIMKEMHLKALVSIPIWVNGSVSMYASFCECRQFRRWNLDEVKFINDTVKIIQSILTKRIQKNSLVRSYEALESILDNVGSAIYVKDATSQTMLFANSFLKKNFAEELERGSLDQMLERSIPFGRTSGHFEIFHKEKGAWYDLYLTPIEWVDGRQVSLYALYDISDKKIYQKKIEQQAYTDFLTGLYNRMCCERDLAWHIDEAKKQEKDGAVMYLDLDDFKHINDGLGHQYGDLLLKSISGHLQRIKGIENSCYRVGGDEFVVIIPPEHMSGYKEIVQQIKEAFGRPWFLKDANYYCTMSMGVVRFPKEGENVPELIQKADIAMYEAKRCGKNGIAVYSEGLNNKSGKRLDLEKNMRNAAAQGCREFEIYYQPIIDNRLEGTPCTGAEALLRWNSIELGFISPNEFIPLAEYLGLINPIGHYVLREACLTCKQWNQSGHPEYKVNVNLSIVQLLQADIVEIVADTIRETGITPQNLTLEVTESLAINDMERMREILGRIKELGVRIALDDFGTGYSSLNHIREIPLDVIKIDQNFVRDLAKDSFSQSFIRMVSELADAINVNVCVEGVETKEQYQILSNLNVNLIQGFFFDKPMKQTDFENKYVIAAKK